MKAVVWLSGGGALQRCSFSTHGAVWWPWDRWHKGFWCVSQLCMAAVLELMLSDCLFWVA